jgi:hypothetical protein
MRSRYAAGFIAIGAAATYILLARPRQLRWRTIDSELDEPLPGDDLLPSPDLVATRAIAVGTSGEHVWPWIVQLGQGRGGFYSYDFLENLVGCDIHSSDRIVPEWQDTKIGDEVKLHPQVALVVAVLDPGRSIVLRGGVPMGALAAPYDFTWAFALRERPDGTTRLLVRERYAYLRPWAPLIVEPTAVLAFVMTERMLRGIRDRAETAAAR